MSETVFVIAEIIVGIAILGVLSAVITVVMARQLGPGTRAEDILRERYARGELTREQFEQMRQDLLGAAEGPGATPPANGRGATVVSSERTG